MGKMSRTKVELLGLLERVVKMYNEDHMTIEDIEEALRNA